MTRGTQFIKYDLKKNNNKFHITQIIIKETS